MRHSGALGTVEGMACVKAIKEEVGIPLYFLLPVERDYLPGLASKHLA